MADAPIDPISTPLEAAIQLHELYQNYQKAGFTKRESLELVKTFFSAAITNARKQEDS